MRSLHADLTAAQKLAPLIDYPSLIGTPKIKAVISNKRGAVRLFQWTNYLSDSANSEPHTVCMPADGSMVRFRCAPINHYLYGQRSTDPTDWDPYPVWTHNSEEARSCAAIAKAAAVIVFWIDYNSPYHVYRKESADSGATFGAAVDMGFVSDANGVVAASFKSNGDIGIVWTIAHEIHAVRRTSGSWGSELDSSKSLNTISGITVCHNGDFNIVVTGIDASSQDGVWQIIWGDGYSKTADTWGDFVEILLREASEDFQYFAPSLDYPDVFRLFFVEYHAGTEQGYRQYWSHSLPSADFTANLWLEPVPFNYAKAYGLAACKVGTNFWLSGVDSVWCASISLVTSIITSDVLEVSMKIKPGTHRSSLTIVLDNTAGTYNAFNYKGWQIAVELGYTTVSGDKYSPCPYFWITGWEFVSPPWFPLRAFYPQGIVGTLKIYCEGAWELLERWRARKKYSWAADAKNSYQLLRWLAARAGLELTTLGSSDALADYYPEFEIPAGYTGKWAFRKLLGWVEDVPVLVGDYIYLKYPEAADTAVYYYNSTWQNQRSDYPNPPFTDHLVYRGSYGVGMWKPNMAQIDTDTLHLEQFAWDEISSHYDRLGRVTQPEYTSASDASRRATRELRRGEIWAGYTGFLNCPMNCGQEEFDVIDIVDVAAGVTNIKRRVLGIETIYKKLHYSYQQVLLLGAV